MTEKLPKDQRVQTIISAAVEEFLLKGYSQTSIDAIALRAGISKGGIYHHFHNKDEILLYANQVFMAPVETMFQELAESDSKVDGLREFIRSYMEYWCKHPLELKFFFLSMNKAFEDPSLSGFYSEYFQQELKFLTDIFSIAHALQELNCNDCSMSAFSLISAMDGSLAYHLMDTSLDVGKSIEAFQNLFVNSMVQKNENSL